MEQTRICSKFSEIFGVDFGGQIFQGSNLCFWVKNLKNISKELSEEHTCERGAPEHLKRGPAGRPRAFLALLHFIFLWWLPGAIICFCPVHLSCFAPSKSREPLLFAFDVHLQYYFFTLCHSLCPMLHHSSHGAIFAENHMSFPCMAAPFFGSFA